MTVLGSRTRTVLLLAVLAAAAGVFALSGGWTKLSTAVATSRPVPAPVPPKPPSDIEDLGWLRIDPGPRPSPSMAGIKPTDLPAHYRSLYRLKPDRRVLYAIEEVDRILAERRKPATLFLGFEGGQWTLRLEKESVGSLPEVPAFSDQERLLRDWTAKRLAQYGPKWESAGIPELESLSADLEQGSAIRTISALRSLNALASSHPRNVNLFAAAARGSVWLAVQAYDHLQLTDPLFGHALALLVLAQAAAPGTMAEDQSLLLFRMGYQAAAAEASRSLDPRSAVAAYVQLESRPLQTAAAAPTAAPRAQYLALRDLGQRAGRDRWFDQFRKTAWARGVNPSSLGLILAYNDYTTSRMASAALAANVLLELGEKAEASSSSTESLWGAEAWPYDALEGYLSSVGPQFVSPPEAQTQKFEQLLGQRAASVDGPLYDRESERSFYRAEFYSGIHGSMTYLMDMQGVLESAEKFGLGMVNPAPGTASQLKNWILKRVSNSRSGKVADDIIPVMEEWNQIGTAPVVLAAQRVAWRAPSGTDPVRRALLRIVFRRLDMRPYGLAEGGRAARFDLMDLGLGDRYVKALVHEEPIDGGDLIVRYPYWARDVGRLKEIATDPRQSSFNRALSLELLEELGNVDRPFLEARYRELMDDQPEKSGVLDSCVAMFQKAGDVEGGEKVIARWLLNRPTKDQDLTWAHVAKRRAELYASKKRWKEAWHAIEPALPSWKEEVLESGAWILEEQGRLDDALAMARRTSERYPSDPPLKAMIARILWRQKKYAEAAETLTSARVLRDADWAGSVASSFARAFENSDPHETQNAFNALRERKVETRSLVPLARAIGEKGNHKLAFALLTSLPASGSSFDSAVAIWAHDEIEKSDGKEAAAQWLREHTRAAHELALIAFQFQRYDILAEHLEDPARPTKDDEVQLVRTAALLMSPEPNPQRREELVRYFESRKINDWVTDGLYLLGQGGEPKFLTEAGSDDAIVTVGWLVGLRAMDERRYQAASDWFEVAVQTDRVTIPPQAWSYEMLVRWQGKGRLLSEFTPEIALARSP